MTFHLQETLRFCHAGVSSSRPAGALLQDWHENAISVVTSHAAITHTGMSGATVSVI
jgi:hypothetical protein